MTSINPHGPAPLPPLPQDASPFELQTRLGELQSKSINTELSSDEIREAIGIIRVLRRTNTGPAGAKKAKKAAPINLDTLLDP